MSAEAQAPEQEAALVESGSLLDSILNETRLKPSDEGFDVAKRGVEAFISELLSSSNTEKVDQSLVDLMISEIDQNCRTRLMRFFTAKKFKRLNQRGVVLSTLLTTLTSVRTFKLN